MPKGIGYGRKAKKKANTMTPGQHKKAKKMAEKMKKHKNGIKNPFALANAMVKRG